MKLTVEVTAEEQINSFIYAAAFYNLCKGGNIDVVTVANMMLSEATNEANRTLCQREYWQRSDTE